MSDTDMQRLSVESECRQLVLRSALMVDQRDYVSLAALFAENAELIRPNGQLLQGRAAIIEAYAQRPASRLTRHLLFGSVFNWDGADQAVMMTPVLLWSGDAGDEPGPFGRPARGQQVVGEFADRFIRTAEGWRIGKRVARFEMFLECE